jgi:hypothetical protein
MDWIDTARKKREIDFEPKYGPIRPKTDKRCFRREALEELIDAISYVQWSKEKGEINRQQWKRMDSGIRAVIRTIEGACNDRFEWETSWL